MADREPRDDRAARPEAGDRSRSSSGGVASGSSAAHSGGKKPSVKRDGKKPSVKRDDGKPYAKRDGDRPYRPREDGAKSYAKSHGRNPYPKRDDAKPYGKRDGDRPYRPREGGAKPYAKRDDGRPYAKRDGDRPYRPRQDGAKPYAQGDGKKPYAKRDDGKPYAKRDGERPYRPRDDGKKPYARRDGGGAGRPAQQRPTRGGADRPDRATRPEEIRSVRPRHDDPFIPDEVTDKDLHPSARNELKTLSKENAEWVARHLAMAAQLIDEDPERAHQHALSASRRAGRIAVVRESLAITAYATGDFALALRELRTYRRISGRDDQIALMVDSERGVGRPDRALEVGRAVDRAALPVPARVELAIAMSGARLDLGQPERALQELEIPEFDPDRAFEWSPALFAARATVLEELGRQAEADEWHRRAVIAADALDEASGLGDLEVLEIEEVLEEDLGEPVDPDPEPEPEFDDSLAEASVTVDDEVREILTDAGVDDASEVDR